MNLSKLEKEVPFDQFSRQFQVATIIRELKKDALKPLEILDVGGYKGRTADFLFGEKVTVVDLFNVREKNYIKGSALDLPFKDASFDFVTSFDVLEHIQEKNRERFILECSRVSRRGIIISAPDKTVLNQIAEKKLNVLYKKLHRKLHPWLKEHTEYGIPDFDLIEKMAQRYKYSTVRFQSNKTQLWFAMQQAIFINSKFPFGAEQFIKLNEFYNQKLSHDDGGAEEGSYRQTLCCLKEKPETDSLIKKMAPLNLPIPPALELELSERINEYYVTLISKTTQLADNYKELYGFYRNQSDKYEAENIRLIKRVSNYERLLPIKLLAKTKNKLRGVSNE